MNLCDALRLPRLPRLAIVGAGGKTSALFQLARELIRSYPAVIVTTTTHLGTGQAARLGQHRMLESDKDIEELRRELPQGIITLTGPPEGTERLGGLSSELLARVYWLAEEQGFPLLVEADGARMKPLKAPAEYEPAIPQFVETVVVVAGMSGVGQPLDESTVHRPERFAGLSGLGAGVVITAEALSRVLAHPQGGLKNIPAQSRRVLLLNQADSLALQAAAGGIARQVLQAYHGVVVASLAPGGVPLEEGASLIYAVHEPVAGIILAAGGSRRFGEPKQLLPWQGQPLVRHAARAALEAGLTPVILVAGAEAEQVVAATQDLHLRIAINPDWQDGQSTSIKTGLRLLPDETGAVIFLLTDQPTIPSTLVRALVEAHSNSLSAIVAPLVDGQRGNPVLFDRRTFTDLLNLTGDVGGRGIFSHHSVEWLPWQDAGILADIDTPQDFQRLCQEDHND